MAANDGPCYKGAGKPRSEALVDRLLAQAGAKSVNIAAMHACTITQSESARVNGALMDDFEVVLKGNCVCLSNFVCSKNDLSLYEALKSELIAYSGTTLKTTDKTERDADASAAAAAAAAAPVASNGLIDWSKHEVYENPTNISATFNAIVEALDHYFDVEVYATRLNYYRDGTTWKPFHHDSHAYGGRALREDFTVGISLGQLRSLQFLHEPSGKMFDFPQANGDCFAFTNEVNTRFKHGVPKSRDPACGDRFSIIAWGRRRNLNERNGGGVALTKALATRRVDCVDDAVEAAYDLVSAKPSDAPTGGMGSRQSSEASDTKKPAADKKKKNRLQ